MGLQIFDRIRRLLHHANALVGNRLDLFGLEFQEEAERLLGHLAWLFALFVLFALFLLCFTATAMILAANYGVLLQVAFGFVVVYGGLAVVAGIGLRRRILTAPPPFAATRAEFVRDEALLRRSSHEVKEGEA